MLILERPWTRQPQRAIAIAPHLRGTIRDVWLGSSPKRTLVQGYPCGAAGFYASSIVGTGVGRGGLFVNAYAAVPGPAYWQIASSANNLFPTGATTIFMVRRFVDTTARGYLTFGYDFGASDRVLFSSPQSGAGTAYFDFGNATAGSGRISATYTVDTDIETIVLVAGPSKGREIWRRGVKLAGNASATAARPSATYAVGLGPAPSTAPDNLEWFLFGVDGREWSDGEIANWFKNPYDETFAPRRIYIPTATAAGYTHPTLSLATATEITATSFKPRVTYTFA